MTEVGIASYGNDANGTYRALLYSPTMLGNFYKETFQTTSSWTPTANGFTNLISVPTTTTSQAFQLYPSVGANGGYMNIATVGDADNNGSYSAPFSYRISGNPYIFTSTMGGLNYFNFPAQQASVKVFGTPPETNNSFGFFAKSGISNTAFAIDQQYKSLYVHSKNGGGCVRSGVATSLPASDSGSSLAPNSYDVLFNKEPNIFFDAPLSSPPLIILISSTGPVALHSMQKNSEGKYVSACVVAARSLSSITVGDRTDTAFYTANTYNFTYALISEDDPFYPEYTAQNGINVFNSNGVKVYSSANFTPSFRENTIEKPYVAIDVRNNFAGYFYDNTSYLSLASNEGVCLNDFQSMVGCCFYANYYINFSGSYIFFGPLSFYGRYVQIAAGSKEAFISGRGSTTYGIITTIWEARWGVNQGVFASDFAYRHYTNDFTYGQSNLMPTLAVTLPIP